MNLQEFYDIGLNFESFVGTGSRSERDRIPKNYNRILLSEDQLETIKHLPSVKFLIVGEMWCPDVQLNVSVVRKLCEINHGFDMRVITKGRGEKFLKPLLGIEEMKIPLILILKSDGELVDSLVERPLEVKKVADFQLIKEDYLKGKYLSSTVHELVEKIKKISK